MIHACCGHGSKAPYAVLAVAKPGTPCSVVEHTSLYHQDALDFFAVLGVGPAGT